MKKQLCFMISVICFNLYADSSITLDQQQLQQAQQAIQAQGNKAIQSMPQASATISNVKLKQLNLGETESQIALAQQQFAKSPKLQNRLPTGEKYYLFSESVVSDNQAYLAQVKKPIDINQAISDYNSLRENAKAKINNNRLIIFISSSMPKKTIVNLMSQASAIGAVFVVRGLIDGSYTKTTKYFYDLKGDNTVGVMINPTLFKAMDVKTVPTFALYQGEQDILTTACSIAPKYSKVSGDVSVHYALEMLARSKNLDLAQIANNEIEILDNSGFYKKRK